MLKKLVAVMTAFMVIFGASGFMFVDHAAKSYKSGKNHLHQVQVKSQKLI